MVSSRARRSTISVGTSHCGMRLASTLAMSDIAVPWLQSPIAATAQLDSTHAHQFSSLLLRARLFLGGDAEKRTTIFIAMQGNVKATRMVPAQSRTRSSLLSIHVQAGTSLRCRCQRPRHQWHAALTGPSVPDHTVRSTVSKVLDVSTL